MKHRHPTPRVIALAAVTLAATASTTLADTGAWIGPVSGLWSNPNNWIQGTVASGTDAVAFFSATLVADTTVTLDLPLSIGDISFNDNSHSKNWHLTSTNPGLVLNLSTAANRATISVNNQTAFIDLSLVGNSSLIKEAFGTLVITVPADYTAPTQVLAGTLQSGVANAIPAGQPLFLDGGTFDLNGNAQQVTSVTGDGVVTNSSATPAHLTISSSSDSTTQTHLTGNLSVTFTGGGNFTLQTTPTYTGLTSIDAGTLLFNANASLHKIDGIGNLTVGSAISLTSDSIQLPTLHVIAGGTYAIRPDGSNANASFLNTLTLEGAADAWTSTVDLTNNKLDLVPLSNRAAALADARNQALFGRTHATGLHASGLPAGETLAVIDNALAGKTSFAGKSANANSILIGPELLGDANIDGSVDLTDLSTLLNNFGAPLPDWSSGNFDGASTIDLTDLSDVLNNFGQSLPNPTVGIIPTPEPASLALLTSAASLLLACRRTRVFS